MLVPVYDWIRLWMGSTVAQQGGNHLVLGAVDNKLSFLRQKGKYSELKKFFFKDKFSNFDKL